MLNGNVKMRVPKFIKRNAIVVYSYNKYLEIACRDVESYIFVANSGRSGSTSLAKIFEAVDDIVCLHEPSPVMINEYGENDKQTYFKKLFYNLKRVYVKRAARGHKYYLETNHQFIKNFAEYAIEYFGNKIKVIHLVRDPVSVAASFYLINSSPGTTSRGRYYLIDPKSHENIIKIADVLYESNEFSDDLYKCLWYWYEVEARTKKIKNDYPHVEFYKIHTSDLNNQDKLKDMLAAIDVTYDTDKLDVLVGTKANTRSEEKKVELDMAEIERMNKKLVAVMEDRYGKDFWVS